MSGKKEKTSKKKQDIEVTPEKVTFSTWFFRNIQAKKLQSWQEKEILVFFKSKGLSENEESDKYSELLKLY